MAASVASASWATTALRAEARSRKISIRKLTLEADEASTNSAASSVRRRYERANFERFLRNPRLDPELRLAAGDVR